MICEVKEKPGRVEVITEQELKKGTKRFALRILKLVAALPKTVAGRTIGGQLARSGTRSRQTIGRHAELVQRLSLFRDWVW